MTDRWTGVVTCPLCGGARHDPCEQVAAADVFTALREVWAADISVDVERDHSPSAVVTRVRCQGCGLDHFDPPVPGDNRFYDALSAVGNYPSRWEFEAVRSRLSAADIVVDLGAGDGTFLAGVQDRVSDVLGMDLSSRAVGMMRSRGIPAEVGDATRAGDRGRSFSAVCAFQVLEHVARVDDLMRPALRLLAPGGRLFVSVPNRDRWGRGPLEPLDWPPHHLSRWSPQQLRALADRHDLELVDLVLEQGEFSAAAEWEVDRVEARITGVPRRWRRLFAKAIRRATLTEGAYARIHADGGWGERGVFGHTMLAELRRRDEMGAATGGR